MLKTESEDIENILIDAAIALVESDGEHPLKVFKKEVSSRIMRENKGITLGKVLAHGKQKMIHTGIHPDDIGYSTILDYYAGLLMK